MHRKHLRATVGTADVDIPTGTFIQDRFLYFNGIAIITVAALRGPVSSTDNAVTRWDGTTGTLVQNSTVLIDDSGNVTGVTTLNTRDPARWVDGPVSGGSTDNAIARWDGTTGRLIQNSVVVIDDTGNITGATVGGVDPARWVQGPISGGSTDNAIARWDGTTGRLIQNSTVIVSDTGNVTGVTDINGTAPGDWVRGPTPATATDNALARWDATTGRLIQNSLIIVSDTGAVTGVLTLNTRDVARWTDGPAAGGSTNNATALWDGTTGRLLKNSNVIMDPTTGDITTPGDITPGKVAGVPVGVLVKSSGATPHPDNVITRWSSAAGHPLKDSTIVLDDTGAMTSMTTINGIVVDDLVTNGHHTGTAGNVPTFTTWFDIEDSGVPAASIVLGPASSVSTNLAGFAGTTGKQIYDTGLKITDTVRSTTNSTDNAVARWDGTVGNVIQNSVVIISDTGAITGATTLNGKTIANIVVSDGSAVTAFNLPRYSGTTGTVIVDSGVDSSRVTTASGTSTDNAIARWDGTTGLVNTKLQNSVVTISDTGAISGVTTLNSVNPSNWVVGPATATDNAVVRFDGTTGKLVQDSAVTIADTTGNITAGTYNGVNVAAHATRHLGGGADTLLAAGFSVGDYLVYNGVGQLFGHATPSTFVSTIGIITARTIGINTGIENYGGLASGDKFVFVFLIPYVLTDSGTVQFKYTLTGGATSSGVGIQVGAVGGVATTSGSYGTLSGLAQAGLMIIAGAVTGPGDISFTMNVTGSGINTRDGVALYFKSV